MVLFQINQAPRNIDGTIPDQPGIAQCRWYYSRLTRQRAILMVLFQINQAPRNTDGTIPDQPGTAQY